MLTRIRLVNGLWSGPSDFSRPSDFVIVPADLGPPILNIYLRYISVVPVMHALGSNMDCAGSDSRYTLGTLKQVLESNFLCDEGVRGLHIFTRCHSTMCQLTRSHLSSKYYLLSHCCYGRVRP